MTIKNALGVPALWWKLLNAYAKRSWNCKDRMTFVSVGDVTMRQRLP